MAEVVARWDASEHRFDDAFCGLRQLLRSTCSFSILRTKGEEAPDKHGERLQRCERDELEFHHAGYA